MLDPAAHFDKIAQNVAARELIGLDVDEANSDEKIHSGDNVPSVLDQLVQVCHFPAFLKLVQKEQFQMAELVANRHVELVVALR